MIKLPDSKKVLALLVVLTIVSALGKIYVSNELAVKGQEISKIRTEIESVDRENKLMRSLISSTSSLAKVKELAFSYGMVEAGAIEFLKAPVTAALELKTP